MIIVIIHKIKMILIYNGYDNILIERIIIIKYYDKNNENNNKIKINKNV